MTKVRMLLATTLALSGLAHASDEPVEFYFANDLVLQQVAAGKDPAEAQLAATAEFTRHCLAGAQLAMLAEGYKPDPAMPLEERRRRQRSSTAPGSNRSRAPAGPGRRRHFRSNRCTSASMSPAATTALPATAWAA